MGWKGTIRSLNAISRQAERESQKRRNAANRELTKIDKNVDQIITKAANFEKKLIIDPIKYLNIRYDENNGFVTEPFEFNSDYFNGSIGLDHSFKTTKLTFTPKKYSTDFFCLIPLDILFTPWGSILAIKIENNDDNYRIKTPWFKKSDTHNSSIYMLNPETSSYYYPISALLSGEILYKYPKIVLVAFETFREVPNNIQIHISDVKLTSERGKKYTCRFETAGNDLKDSVSNCFSRPSISDEIMKSISIEADKLKEKVQPKGCLVFIIPFVAGLVSFGYYLIA